MNHFLNRLSTPTTVFMLLLGILLPYALLHEASAQTSSLPTFTISSEGAENGAEQQGTKNILLRERRLTLMTYDAQPQRGYVVIRRVTGSAATVTLRLGISYQDMGNRFLPDNGTQPMTLPALYTSGSFSQRVPSGVTTSSVAINGLMDDLQPFLFANNLSVPVATIGTTSQAVHELIFNPQVQAAVIRFTARWSDQSYPRNPGIQGQRTAIVSLLPGDGYEIPSGFNALTRITLEDPANTPPMTLSSFCHRVQPLRLGDILTILIPGQDATNWNNSLFYDDNYDSLAYAASSSNEALMRPRSPQGDYAVFDVINSDPASPLWQSSTRPTVSISARDLRGGATTQTCTVTGLVRVSVHDNPSNITLSAAPNPASTETRLSYTLQEPSAVQIEVYSALGERLITIDEGLKTRGEHTTTLDVERLATGVYPVRLRVGRETRSVMMRVLR